jgi:hypothetical protein
LYPARVKTAESGKLFRSHSSFFMVRPTTVVRSGARNELAFPRGSSGCLVSPYYARTIRSLPRGVTPPQNFGGGR